MYYVISMQKRGVAARSANCGKSRKRALPESTDKEPVSRKKVGFEVQHSTTRMSEFGGSVTAVWVINSNLMVL